MTAKKSGHGKNFVVRIRFPKNAMQIEIYKKFLQKVSCAISYSVPSSIVFLSKIALDAAHQRSDATRPTTSRNCPTFCWAHANYVSNQYSGGYTPPKLGDRFIANFILGAYVNIL